MTCILMLRILWKSKGGAVQSGGVITRGLYGCVYLLCIREISHLSSVHEQEVVADPDIPADEKYSLHQKGSFENCNKQRHVGYIKVLLCFLWFVCHTICSISIQGIMYAFRNFHNSL